MPDMPLEQAACAPTARESLRLYAERESSRKSPDRERKGSQLRSMPKCCKRVMLACAANGLRDVAERLGLAHQVFEIDSTERQGEGLFGLADGRHDHVVHKRRACGHRIDVVLDGARGA